MRNYYPEQTVGILQVPIESVPLDPNCNEGVIHTLRGLQSIYSDKAICLSILNLIKADASEHPDEVSGAKGLSLWEIFVLATIRRSGRLTSYRKLAHLASTNIDLIGILGHGSIEGQKYSHSTIQENVILVTPQTLDEINVIIANHAGQYVENPFEKVRVDSFVFLANIHHHADYKSLEDGARVLMREGKRLAKLTGQKGFRQASYLARDIKHQAYNITQKNRSTKTGKEVEVQKLYIKLLDSMDFIFDKILDLLTNTKEYKGKNKAEHRKYEKLVSKLYFFLSGTAIEHELAHRRIVLGEIIPSKEKIFSIFKPDTEIISKGKIKAPHEYGHAVTIAESVSGIILKGERIESGSKDSDICIPFVRNLQKNFDKKILKIAFDKAYRTPDNAKEIAELIPSFYLPSKGKNASMERTEEYYDLKHWRSGIESGINALEQGNNMAICRDKGLEGFDRCVAGSIVARNLQTLGVILLTKSKAKLTG